MPKSEGIEYVSAYHKSMEVNSVVDNAVSVDLQEGNEQKIDLSDATGGVTVTLNAPSGPSSGNLLIQQDGTARDITWVAGSGITTGRWLGTEPTWSSDTASLYRIVSWMFDGTDIFLAFTSEQGSTF